MSNSSLFDYYGEHEEVEMSSACLNVTQEDVDEVEEEEEEEELDEEDEDEDEDEDEIGQEDEEEGSVGEEDMNNTNKDAMQSQNEENVDETNILEDIDVVKLTPAEFKKLRFPTGECAYYLYNQYARINGFGIRRSKRGRNKNKEIIWLKFVCNKEGFWENKYFNLTNRKRWHRALTRCGCLAELRVKYNCETGLWDVIRFSDDHNHDLVAAKCKGLCRSHRKMCDGDIAELNNMRKAGISTPLIHAAFAVELGGVKNVEFGKRQMHYQLFKQRKLLDSDLNEALKYLANMKKVDGSVFWKHLLESDGSFLHLFWCDGGSRLDYQLFGDVLAFDATYKKNKYKLPVIIFSGMNHHKQTCVFAACIVSNETEATYVWVLEQFLEAMRGKCPRTVITDGDQAIKNAIAQVFPQAHHRLCAWHLLRNATSNVKKPYFTKKFRKLMLGDYERSKFEEKWKKLVVLCQVEDNPWVCDLYQKKMMWASAHMRGKFFAGLRTTSRCEGLHAVIGRYVKKGYNLVEFIEQFDRCLENLRSTEVAADFKSLYTEPVIQTELVALERYGSQIYTREIFDHFCTILKKAATVVVLDVRETPSSRIYIMGRYCCPNMKWHVSYYPHEEEFRCSCERMESIGIPCCHIIQVLVQLDFRELPNSLVVERWTRGVKEGLLEKYGQDGHRNEEVQNQIKYNVVLHSCRQMCKLACFSLEDLIDVKEMVEQKKMTLREKHGPRFAQSKQESRKKGLMKGVAATRSDSLSVIKKTNKPQRCSICRKKGHNRATCRIGLQLQDHVEAGVGCSSSQNANIRHDLDMSSDDDMEDESMSE